VTGEQLARVRSLFPALDRYVYFNHASNGPTPIPAVEAMTGYIERFSRHGEVPYAEAEAAVEDARQMAAKLAGTKPSEVAFVKNTSAGAIVAIGSIEWHAGDNMILMRDAFPTNTCPFEYLLPHVEKRYVTSHEVGHGPDCIFRLVDRHTRAIAIDWVHFLSGVRADVRAIADFCKTRAVFFLLDAMQGLGAVDEKLGDAGVDFVYAGGNKWLLGPHGSGVLYVREGLLPKLRPANMGWLSAQWEDFNDIFSHRVLKPGASRYEEGTKNYIGIYGLRESLRILLDVGMDTVWARIRTLVKLLKQRLEERGFAVLCPADLERGSGVLSAYRPGADMAVLFERLKARGFALSLRDNKLRISPHFYNTEEEVERLGRELAAGGT
jgi:selenocysteine lyase/cysteine desulfurase